MEILYDTDNCPAPDHGSVVTIGAYDGVHLGHQAVIAEVRRRAAERGEESVVVTFDRHPAQMIRPDSAPKLLTGLEHKLELLNETGVDRVLVIHFDERRAAQTAEDFVETVLSGCLRAHEVVVGEDFHFGHLRRGDVALLNEMGRRLGFSVVGYKLVGPDGNAARDDAQVSSTAIRRAIHEGRIADANLLLGRPHEMRGDVVPGDQRGRQLGFPTANVAVPDEMLMPADGIYAGWIKRLPGIGKPNATRSALGEGSLPTAIYIGKRPTFYDDRAMTLLEVHILDFSGDVYGERVSVSFTHRIRPDARFASIEELTAQLQHDCDRARGLLGTASQ